mgnify:CR=1 FL=1
MYVSVPSVSLQRPLQRPFSVPSASLQRPFSVPSVQHSHWSVPSSQVHNAQVSVKRAFVLTAVLNGLRVLLSIAVL